MDAAIDVCIAATYTFPTDVPSCRAECPELLGPDGMPPVPQCNKSNISNGLILPSDPMFKYIEYESASIEAGPCYATCCDGSYYYWVEHSNRYVSRAAWGQDVGVNQFDSALHFESLAESKKWCEIATPAQCAGIYDRNCDGGHNDQIAEGGDWDPVYVVPEADYEDTVTMKSSSRGSCVLEMVLGQGTTLTSTFADHRCTFEVNVSNSDVSLIEVYESWTVYNSDFDDLFRFTTCSLEGAAAEFCIAQGKPNGVRMMTNRAGHAVKDSVCCDQTTMHVLNYQRLDCDGFKATYTKHPGKYLPAQMLMRVTELTFESAEARCLKLGEACSGFVDDNCDGVNFDLIEMAHFNGTDASLFLDSSVGSCSYLKDRVPDHELAARPFLSRYQLFLTGKDRCASAQESNVLVFGHYDCESKCDKLESCQFYSFGTVEGNMWCYLTPDCMATETVDGSSFEVYSRSPLVTAKTYLEYFHDAGNCKGDQLYCFEDDTLANCISHCNHQPGCGAFNRLAEHGPDDLSQCCIFKAQTTDAPFGEAASNCYQKRPHDAPRPAEPAVLLLSDCYDAEQEQLTILSNGNWATEQGLAFNRLDVFPNAEIICSLRFPGSTIEFVKMAAGNSDTGGVETPREIQVFAGSSLSQNPADWVLKDTIYYDTDVVDSIQTATAREMLLKNPVTTSHIKLVIKDNYGSRAHTTLRQIAFMGTRPGIPAVAPVVNAPVAPPVVSEGPLVNAPVAPPVVSER